MTRAGTCQCRNAPFGQDSAGNVTVVALAGLAVAFAGYLGVFSHDVRTTNWLQALIAGVICTAAFARMYWTRFKEIMRRAFGSQQHGDSSKDQ